MADIQQTQGNNLQTVALVDIKKDASEYAPATAGFNIEQKGLGNAGSVSVLNTATLIIAANKSRKRLLIANNGSVAIFLGHTTGVTAANGFPLPAGQVFEDTHSSDAWYGITASSTADTRYDEIA